MNSSYQRDALQSLARETMAIIKKGKYTLKDTKWELETKDAEKGTRFLGDRQLEGWSNDIHVSDTRPAISILEISTIDCARMLNTTLINLGRDEADKIGILNFASATKPGGGFQNGAQAQEESLARSSTLYPTLRTSEAQHFYRNHNEDDPYYTHSIVYSPNVEIFRTDSGELSEPVTVNVVTCAAVNAGELRKQHAGPQKGIENIIRSIMSERMARILYSFEIKGTRNVVLGAFGAGIFRNDVDVVAAIWAELLNGRFSASFDRVIFAIIGRKAFIDFEDAFQATFNPRCLS